MTTGKVNSTEAVLERHLKMLLQGDVDNMIKDYANDAVLFVPNGPLKGYKAIRTFFEAMLKSMPPEAVKNFKLLRQDVDGEYAYILYSALPMISFGGDMFHVHDGKIVAQCGVMPPS
jgi:ketosteroid isomerase-like protein